MLGSQAMGEPQRRCASCGQNYADGVLFCPNDGTALSQRARDQGPDAYLGQTLAGTYRVEALIGTGAVGGVYRAHQLGVERNVALKIMHRDLASNETLRGRFRREARVAGALCHPNLVNVLALGELQGDGPPIPFIALEYLDGLSLRSALAAQGALSVSRTLHIALQIADAVGEAHRAGVVHRDLKPDNVMLVQRGEDADFVKVLDFGVARIGEGDPSIATHAGAIFGSARYVAPEVAAGQAATARSDVYALSTMVYECLAGATPFTAENPIQMLLQQQRAPVPALAERVSVPRELARVVEQNLAKDPNARAEDARAFMRELVVAAGVAGLDPGLSSRTRRGHALDVESLPRPIVHALAEPRKADEPAAANEISPQRAATRRALVVALCFALGAVAAFGIASKLGAFGNKAAGASGAPPLAGTP